MYNDKALSEYLASIKNDRSMTNETKASIVEHLKKFIIFANTPVAAPVEPAPVIEPVKEPYAPKEKQISQSF